MPTRGAALVATIVFIIAPELAWAKKPEIVQVSSDSYMIFKEDHKGIFGSLAKLKIGIIKQANEFAVSKGKVLIPISCKEKPLGNGPAQWASFEYQFKLVSKDDPEADRATLGSCPDFIVQTNQSLKAEVTTREEKAKPEAPKEPASAGQKDLYTELMKLDDLRKRGILTEEEFQAEKRKLLETSKPTERPPQ
jgi:Short C-terminal domain